MTVTNLCVCVSSECVVWTLWMCACAALWAKMSQKSVISVALFASKAEINVFFYCACFKRVWTLTKETLISGIEVVLLFTLLHYFCHFLSHCGTYLCVYMINCEFDFAIFAKRQTNIFQDDASACIKCTLKDVQKIKKEKKMSSKTKFMENFLM